ncbi:ABC-2 type transport system ATP-binding protein/sodium transport system ATP-binding protein [Neorhodopirellula lusitana]|uniref:ABC-2 type transport system ATP-binding protein/sodium transport system ATP-binding protein n=1 Tax=Neorhodopirellula lusitana TaxID=445327 RepID=A0ABY1PSB2_9BACT|nr:ATP-binding cassette domain-containing protein [Neorhodopirellula lusitana]SMP40469.1 ABC-2 type transport system ATP-binding protein/sodium transport system ATP-binding protein [Neorhodopirellula lusitana]
MLKIQSLSKRFVAESETVHAVDGLSFEVHPGEVFGLLGPNGAGKTTTLRMVLGLVRPDDGYTEVSGIRTSVDPFAAKAKLGFVSASDGVYPWLTVREMLLYFADLYGVEPTEASGRLETLADVMDIVSLLDRRAGSLSTGQRQRVTLVRGLIHDPPVMLLDEPTRGLDVVGVQTIFRYIAHLRETGKAVVVCTHRLDEAERLCDQFGLLHRGRLCHHGTLEEVRRDTGREHLVEMFDDLMNPATIEPSA